MLKVMIDTCVESAAEYVEGVTWTQTLECSGGHSPAEMSGFRRIQPHRDPTYQAQTDALFTIGRLIHTGEIEAYTYNEIMAEAWRRNRGKDFVGSAFRGCKARRCAAPVERSVWSSLSFEMVTAKGGKADQKAGRSTDGSQIAFCKFLLCLTPDLVGQLLALGDRFARNEFEKESLRNVSWYQQAVNAAPSEENYPDFFHLWTAVRNNIDVFLTLETKLPRYAQDLKSKGLLRSLEVLRPLDLLARIGISEPDAVPLEVGKVYAFSDLMGVHFDGWPEWRRRQEKLHG